MNKEYKAGLIAVVIIIGLLVLLSFIVGKTGTNEATPEIPAAGEISIVGETTCLPHRDTSGPQTLECALGLEGEDGNNYALDLEGLTPDQAVLAQTGGTRITVEGDFTPLEALSSSEWQKYDMVGIIRAESVNTATAEDATVRGSVVSVNTDGVPVDGPALITLRNEEGSETTIAIRSMGINLCPAQANIADYTAFKPGMTIEARGSVGPDGQIVPCESEDHFLRVVTG